MERRALELLILAGEHAGLRPRKTSTGRPRSVRAWHGPVALQARAPRRAPSRRPAGRPAGRRAPAADARLLRARRAGAGERPGRVEQLRRGPGAPGRGAGRLAEEAGALTARPWRLWPTSEWPSRRCSARCGTSTRRRAAGRRPSKSGSSRSGRACATRGRPPERLVASRSRWPAGDRAGSDPRGPEERSGELGRRLSAWTPTAPGEGRVPPARHGPRRGRGSARRHHRAGRHPPARAGGPRRRAQAAAAARGRAVEAAEEARGALAGRRSSLTALEELEAQRAGYGHGVQAIFAAARESRLDVSWGRSPTCSKCPATSSGRSRRRSGSGSSGLSSSASRRRNPPSISSARVGRTAAARRPSCRWSGSTVGPRSTSPWTTRWSGRPGGWWARRTRRSSRTCWVRWSSSVTSAQRSGCGAPTATGPLT